MGYTGVTKRKVERNRTGEANKEGRGHIRNLGCFTGSENALGMEDSAFLNQQCDPTLGQL